MRQTGATNRIMILKYFSRADFSFNPISSVMRRTLVKYPTMTHVPMATSGIKTLLLIKSNISKIVLPFSCMPFKTPNPSEDKVPNHDHAENDKAGNQSFEFEMSAQYRDDRLEERYGGRERGKQHQKEKEHSYEISERGKSAEYVGQNHKHE